MLKCILQIKRKKFQARNEVTLAQINLKISPKKYGMENGFKRAQIEDRTEVSETIRLRLKAGIIPGGKARSKINETW